MTACSPPLLSAPQNSRPTSTFTAVQSRLALSRALTQDLAAYYSERALVEEAYVKSLQKLSSRLHGSPPVLGAVEQLGLGRDEGRQLGGWKALLARVEGEVGETARVHDLFRKRVEEEVAAPLRASIGKGDWLKWGSQEQQLGATAKNYEKTLDKVQQVSISNNRPRAGLVLSAYPVLDRAEYMLIITSTLASDCTFLRLSRRAQSRPNRPSPSCSPRSRTCPSLARP